MSEAASPSETPQSTREPSSWAMGLAAARANFRPGILLWLLGVSVLASYFGSETGRSLWQQIGQWKLAGGFGFSAISTSIFAGLIPWVIRAWIERRHDPKPPGPLGEAPTVGLSFLMAFWAFKGLEVDLLYRMQAMWFGDDRAFSTVLLKVIIDQALYVPLWATPSTLILMRWHRCGYRASVTIKSLGPRWWWRQGVPLTLANWAVWIPAVVMIYQLPLPLQLPVQNLVLCFWSLMLILIVRQ